MSLILDALRKADSQRERDPARGIHARPVQASSQLKRPEGQRSALWLWGMAAVGAGLLVVAAWQMAGPAAPPGALAPIAGGVPVPAPAVEMSPPAPLTAPAAPATEVLPAAPPARAPTPAAPVPVAAPAREVQKPASATSRPVPAAAARDRVLSVNELPAEVQRELPKLLISAGVYSDNPAQRMLIINGQAAAEGAEPAPGVLLEQIRARTAVLKFRGYRYSVMY